MPILTKEDVAEFQRLAEIDGVKLTEEEAHETAMRLVLLYRHLARPTPGEIREAPLRRAEEKVRRWSEPENRVAIGLIKRKEGSIWHPSPHSRR